MWLCSIIYDNYCICFFVAWVAWVVWSELCETKSNWHSLQYIQQKTIIVFWIKQVANITIWVYFWVWMIHLICFPTIGYAQKVVWKRKTYCLTFPVMWCVFLQVQVPLRILNLWRMIVLTQVSRENHLDAFHGSQYHRLVILSKSKRTGRPNSTKRLNLANKDWLRTQISSCLHCLYRHTNILCSQ